MAISPSAERTLIRAMGSTAEAKEITDAIDAATSELAGDIVANTVTASTGVITAAITGSDASLGITGQADSGAVAIAGAAPTTSGDGGAVSATGGAGGNGVNDGGAVNLTGGVSGIGLVGAGGGIVITGGANTNSTSGVGGAASMTGGLGKGSLAGGASSVTGGVGGATGAGGAVNITGGASAGGSGPAGSVNITPGAAAGGTVGAVNIAAAADKVGFHGATAIVKHATTGDVTTFAAGSGTASKSDSTWNGASGSTGYTVGDIVTCLKALGLMTT